MYFTKVLQLSTGHIPNPNPNFGSVRHCEHEFGWIVWNWDCENGENVIIENIPEWLKPIWDYANENECTMIEFDRDNPESELFKEYDW